MKVAATMSLFAVTLTIATSADAQVRVRDRNLATTNIVRSKLMHVNPKAGVIDVALATDLPKTVSRDEREQLTGIVRYLRAGKSKEANVRWSRFVKGYSKKSSRAENKGDVKKDVSSVVQWVMAEAYLESNKDLQFYADKVRYQNEIKKGLREHISKMREMRAAMSADARVSVQKFESSSRYSKGQPVIKKGRTTWMSRDELDSYVINLDKSLQKASGNEQLANVDLQNSLQKQQQVMQTMSNVSKMLHDTLKAIIQNIR